MEWISVKDRLPDRSDEFLVNLEGGYGMDIATFDPFGTKGFYQVDEAGYEYSVYVTHWMPLPDPPKIVKSCSTQWRCEHAAIGTMTIEEIDTQEA